MHDTVMSTLHIITCEYPPTIGGVSEHSRVVAEAAATAGYDVYVWTSATSRPSWLPPSGSSTSWLPPSGGRSVENLPADQPPPRLRRSAEALRAKAEAGSHKGGAA